MLTENCSCFLTLVFFFSVFSRKKKLGIKCVFFIYENIKQFLKTVTKQAKTFLAFLEYRAKK